MTAHRPPKAEATAGNPLPIIPTGVSMRTVVERLNACHIEYCDNLPVGYGPPINPDGPEAAALIEELVSTVEKCRDKFRDYERQHEAKAQQIFDDGKTQGLLNAERMAMQARLTKADSNRKMAEMCDTALAKAHHPEEVLK
jgi:hypothetical protein